MTAEEIASDPAGGERRPRRGWLVVAVLAAIGVAVWLAFGGPDGGGQALPAPSPAVSSPGASPTVTQRPGVADAELTFQGLCDPVVTPRRLQVAFTLVNPDPVDLILLTVDPNLPIPGLKWLETQASLGGCGDPADPFTELRVPSGGSVVVAFSFRLPPTCPQATPVGANVTTRVYDVSRSAHLSTIPLYPDLGSIDFATCP